MELYVTDHESNVLGVPGRVDQTSQLNKMRVGILGGSFDPVHFGHIKPCLELAQNFNLSSILLLPCKVSPFKSSPQVSAQHRLKMLSLMATGSELLTVDERELGRDTPSYTYYSLRELADEYGDRVTLCWIMGMDALNEFPDWYKAAEIMKLCHILVLQRPGCALNCSDQKQNWLEQYLTDDLALLEKKSAGHIFVTATEMLDISSSQIRAVIASGEQPRYLLPGSVWNYIQRNHLYASQGNDDCSDHHSSGDNNRVK